MKINLRIFLFLLVLVTSWYGCSLLVKLRPGPGLEKMTFQNVSVHDWSDDLDFKDIETAVARSIMFYERLPQEESFQYGKLKYTPEEMIASLRLFESIVRDTDDSKRTKDLKEKFIFFESRNFDGEALFTGYYEPVLEGGLVPSGELTEPVYAEPHDLVTVDLGKFSEEWKHKKIVGRLQGNELVPYDSRDDIVYRKSLKGRADPIAYVNGIELFFLQIQGSGLIRLKDGTTLRVNYAQKNGRPYRSIGSMLSDKIPEEKMSMQSIKGYLYGHPEEVRDILSYNQSYVFFRVTEEGPLGNIDVPLTPMRSLAMDNNEIPRGGLVYIQTDLPVIEEGRITEWKSVKRFGLVQDTGGAIRGHGRVDIFLGHGSEAEIAAGHLKQRGRIFLLVAKKEFLKQSDQ